MKDYVCTLKEAREKFYPEYRYAVCVVSGNGNHTPRTIHKTLEAAMKECADCSFLYGQLTFVVDLAELSNSII